MSILAGEQQVLDLEGAGVAVLWRREDWFLSTTVYRRFGFGLTAWHLYEPEDRTATNHAYSNADLWAIATLRPETSTISIADGDRRLTSQAELEDLPRSTVLVADGDLYQNYGGEWWRLDGGSCDDEVLRPKELWDWHGESGVTVIWHPSEAGTTS